MSGIKEYSLTDIPSDVLEEAAGSLWQYTIGFVRVERNGKRENATLLGSGVLIKATDRCAILTAAHVIDVLPRDGRLGVILSTKAEQTTIDTGGIEYLKIDRGECAKAGPDLAVVLLSSSIASAIAARKSFYSLDKHRERMMSAPPNDREGIWIASGFVDEFTLLDSDTGPYETVKGFCQFGSIGGVESYVCAGKHDYYTFPVNHQGDGTLPHRFGGVSGSGLWHVLLRQTEAGIFSADEYLLQGLTYFQEAHSEARSDLRCHGPKSIYDVAYSYVSGVEL